MTTDASWENRRIEDSRLGDDIKSSVAGPLQGRLSIGVDADDESRDGRPRAIMRDGQVAGIEIGWGKTKQRFRISSEQSDEIAKNWIPLRQGEVSLWDVLGRVKKQAQPQVQTSSASEPDTSSPMSIKPHPMSDLDIVIGFNENQEVIREAVDAGIGDGDDSAPPPPEKLVGENDYDILYWNKDYAKWELFAAPTKESVLLFDGEELKWLNVPSSKSVLVYDSEIKWVALQEYTC